MKKILCVLCVLSLGLALTACGKSPAKPSEAPDNFTWEWESVSGGVNITGYNGDDTNIVIPSILDNKKVVKLSSDVFSGNVTIKSIVLSEHMTSLNSEAFAGCDALISITAPGATNIDGRLTDLPALTSLIVPAVRVFSIESVMHCPSLQKLDVSGCHLFSKPYYSDIPDSITEIILPDSLSYHGIDEFYLPHINAVLCTKEYAEKYNHINCQPITDALAVYKLIFPKNVTVVVGDEHYFLGE